jgi:DNA invertase Pin-like site-specific DNA recombinase
MRCNRLNIRVIWLVDLTLAYYNSEPQVKGLLARLRRLVAAIDARDWHEPVPQLSQLAQGCRNGQPRAIRDRLTSDEYQRLLDAGRAGVPKRQLAKQYGVSLRTVYRLAVQCESVD